MEEGGWDACLSFLFFLFSFFGPHVSTGKERERAASCCQITLATGGGKQSFDDTLGTLMCGTVFQEYYLSGFEVLKHEQLHCTRLRISFQGLFPPLCFHRPPLTVKLGQNSPACPTFILLQTTHQFS